MKAMTLWQPWASLIAEGVKTIETRPKRSPWSSVIGETIAIHAAQGERWREGQAFGDWRAYRTSKTHAARMYNRDAQPMVRRLPLGVVVATARIDAVVPMVDKGVPSHEHRLAVYDEMLVLVVPDRHTVDVTDQRPFGDFAPGRWAILLDDIVKLPEPIPARGFQGLWTMPNDIAAALRTESP